MEFHERLVFILTEAGISSRILYSNTEKSPTTISNYRTGKSFPDLDFFNLLKELIPNYNANWLIHNEGEPFLSDEETNENSNTFDEKKAEMQVQKNDMLHSKIAKIETALEEVKQLAMVGLEKLRGVASVRLNNYLNQFVNTQNLHLCK